MKIDGEIIIIEDDPDDRDFLADIFESLELPNKVVFFEDPTLVVPYLEIMESKPFMVLSDVNMPKLNGFELRKLIIENDVLAKKCVPYIFLSTSENTDNIDKAFELAANGYFKKETVFSVYQTMISDIVSYWKRSRKPQ